MPEIAAGGVVWGPRVPQHRLWVQAASAWGRGAGARGRGGGRGDGTEPEGGGGESQVVQQHPAFPGLSPSSGRALQAQTAEAAVSGRAVPERGILFG